MSGKEVLRILAAAVAVLVFMTIVGMISCGWLFTWVYQIEPTNIWRPMDGPPGALFYTGSLVMNIIFAGVYVLFRKGIPGKTVIGKGIVYGLCVFGLGHLPGMFSMYIFMTVAPQVLLYWTIHGIITMPINGIIVAAICDKE